jgi:hypothetical protein
MEDPRMLRTCVAALAALSFSPAAAAAQSQGPVPTIAIDVRTPAGLREQRGGYLAVVAAGVAAAGAHFVALERASVADSAIYGVLDIERDAGAYRIALRLVGRSAPPGGRCASQATGGAPDLLFGAILATEVAEFARCARSGSPAVR